MSRPMREDLKAIPDEVRATRREAERKLADTAEEHPAVRQALDLRLLVVNATIALVLALALRLAGLGFAISLLVFLVLFLGGWVVLARASAPRQPNRPVRS